ncbi:phosphatase PAP2 family protein [Flavobacterium psychrophilum]|uniref:phosphatase PAP2 family protein n=1 Tax=Flavobacterium psychrophilum TaxID=96345 RepID=UPI003B42B9C9
MKKSLFYTLFAVIASLQFNLVAQEIDSLKQIENKHEKTRASQEYEFSDGTTRTYSKPKLLEIVTKAPKDFLNTNIDFVAKDHAWYLAGALASTLVLLPIDQQITDQSRAWSERNGLSESNRYGKLGPLENKPENIGAAFYLLGNGTTVVLLGAGFATYGLLKNNYRAQATASSLIESLLVSGVFVQSLKRITGRESPFIAMQKGHPGGEWNPFPSFPAYAKDTPNYDAMPSGHLTTIMSGLTIIITNYPDYKWLKPVCYTAMAGLCFQMVQSQVHWASDYPMAIFMGYFIGKTIAKNRFKETKKAETSQKKYTYNFSASRQYGINTVGVTVKF